ncbi:MAG TPA: cadherin-like domain-containing protein, partial [Rubricoccaceae bacterium]
PAATVASFGGGAVGGTAATNAAGTTATFGAGGSLTVNADGSYSLTAPAGFAGPLAFEYRLANSAGGDVASVTVTVTVPVAPTAAADGPTATSVPGDPYHAAFNTAFALAAPGVIANDNLGTPVATATSFGGGSLGGAVTANAAGATATFGTGGSLTVNADGSVAFTPPSGFTGLFTFGYRTANVRGTSDAQVTIAVGVRPAAAADTYTPVLVGNVSINTGRSTQFNVTSNDTGTSIVPALVGATNGTAVVNADGTFTFTPTRGYEGPASFSYTVTNGFGTTAPVTVSLTVGPPVFFVNAGAAAGGDGQFGAPYNTLSGLAAANNGTGTNPATGDRVFLYTGAYSGTVTLLGGQQLVGQGATGASFGAVLGVTWPADAGPEPTVNGTAPTITSATTGVTLGSGNTLRGFNLGNVTTGAALSGTGFGTLVVSGVGINTTGQALSLTTGTLNGGFTQLRSTGGTNNVFLSGVATTGTSTLGGAGDVLSGATGDAVVVAGGTGSFTYSGNVTQASNAATVNVSGGHSGTLTFQTGTVSATNGTGLQFNNADGTYA